MQHVETIIAEATPKGRGGVAIVRLSGPQVIAMMQAAFDRLLLPKQATYLTFYHADREPIDEGIAIFFPNPHSFTGEDVLECHCHGSPIVVDQLIQRFIQLGARCARPGEFSERAFLNNKIDLTQAEAIADLINAHSQQAARLALRSLQGEFSKQIGHINEQLIVLRTQIEAMIDFSEDVAMFETHTIRHALRTLIQQLETLQAQAKHGSLLQEGITIAITGKPNVGKSSLLNRLSEKEAAIVTALPGTTRDIVKETILIHDMPIHIMDTAGIRETTDLIEAEGIRRAKTACDQADLILHVMDAAQTDDVDVGQDQRTIIVRNKIDLLSETAQLVQQTPRTVVSLSVKTGDGLSLLKQVIAEKVGLQTSEEGLFLARRRHLEALTHATAHLQTAMHHLQTTSIAELIAEELRLAQLKLNEITGDFTTEDLLGRIFSTFCIGK